MVCELAGYEPKIVTQPDMPVGPMNRVADNSLGKELLGWEPTVPFAEGLRRTFEWYFATKDADEVREILDFMLTGRGPPPRSLARPGWRPQDYDVNPVLPDRPATPQGAERRCRVRTDWPQVNGVRIDTITPDNFIDSFSAFLACGHSHVVHFCAAHPTVEARDDPDIDTSSTLVRSMSRTGCRSRGQRGCSARGPKG